MGTTKAEDKARDAVLRRMLKTPPLPSASERVPTSSQERTDRVERAKPEKREPSDEES
jgi:hypothetical protein